jgi:outer membrane receptor protein involved in Fe transport
LETKYTGNRGLQQNDITKYPNYDTTVTQVHGYWLPDVSLKYKPLDWLDIRLSYTNTLSYPDYYNLIPYMSVAYSSTYCGNYELKPSRSANYDAYVSVYENSIGLFTVGGFLKEIKDFIYSKTFTASGEEVLKYLPVKLFDNAPVGKYTVGTYINHPYTIKDY